MGLGDVGGEEGAWEGAGGGVFVWVVVRLAGA